MPTRGGTAPGDRRDVAPEAHAFEAHPLDCLICLLPRLLEFRSDRGHRQDTAAVRDEPAVAHRRPTVEDESAGGFGLGDSVDRRAGVVAPLRVLRARKHDRHGGVAAFPERVHRTSVRRRCEGVEEIPLEARQERLRLGVAESRVELEHVDAVVGQHQAGEETADERRPTACELDDDRLMDAGDELAWRLEPRDGRVRAHASGVRTEITVQCPLEVSCRAERHGLRPVTDRKQRYLPPFEQLLDHERPAERCRLEQRVVDLLGGPADEDALAGGEPVGLDHARGARDRQRRCGRDADGVQHLLGEALRPFDPCGGGTRAEDGDAGVPQLVRDARDKRCFRPDDGEVGRECDREPEQPVAVVGAHGVTVPEPGNARIAGRCVQFRQRRALRQSPRERMLARARADEEHPHGASLLGPFCASPDSAFERSESIPS